MIFQAKIVTVPQSIKKITLAKIPSRLCGKVKAPIRNKKAPYDKEGVGKQIRADKKCRVLKSRKCLMYDKNTRENKDF